MAVRAAARARAAPDAGAAQAATCEFQYPPSVICAGLPLVLYERSVHMRVLGKAARVELRRADGSSECPLDIPDEDFAWGGFCAFAKPVRIEHDDERPSAASSTTRRSISR